VLDCKGGGQEKWSSGLQEALPTDHNGDVPCQDIIPGIIYTVSSVVRDTLFPLFSLG
jgi:hypothetical protein